MTPTTSAAPLLLLACVLLYFAALLGVAWWTGRRADNAAFFIGSRNSNWRLVAFGMIGTSLSGVTFVSVPGAVGATQFHYLQITLGYVLGYVLIAQVLLPLYFRLGLTSIYGFLGQRFGPEGVRTGALGFIVSRTLGATARLYLVTAVLQGMILDALGVPFAVTAAAILLMVLLYTLEGGVRTIVFTDTLQTAGMLTGLVVCAAALLHALDLSPWAALQQMQDRGLATVWGLDPMAKDHWAKQLLAGAAITVAMTGLDQEMMQKSLSVRALRDAQKNLLWLAVALVGVIGAFLFLGGLLHLYAPGAGVTAKGDALFPAVVMGHLPMAVQVLFVIALVSALFPSADGALTALTSSTCLDLLRLPERPGLDEAAQARLRRRVHLAYAALFLGLVLVFRAVADPSMIGLILKLAAYTYGPLLGLFAFGLFSTRAVRRGGVLAASLAAPALCWLIDANQRLLFGPWQIGLELLVLNGALTAAGLALLSRRPVG